MFKYLKIKELGLIMVNNPKQRIVANKMRFEPPNI